MQVPLPINHIPPAVKSPHPAPWLCRDSADDSPPEGQGTRRSLLQASPKPGFIPFVPATDYDKFEWDQEFMGKGTPPSPPPNPPRPPASPPPPGAAHACVRSRGRTHLTMHLHTCVQTGMQQEQDNTSSWALALVLPHKQPTCMRVCMSCATAHRHACLHGNRPTRVLGRCLTSPKCAGSHHKELPRARSSHTWARSCCRRHAAATPAFPAAPKPASSLPRAPGGAVAGSLQQGA